MRTKGKKTVTEQSTAIGSLLSHLESAGLGAASLCGGYALQRKHTETERLVQYAKIIERSPAGRRFGVTPSAPGSERLHFLDLSGGGGGGAGGAFALMNGCYGNLK